MAYTYSTAKLVDLIVSWRRNISCHEHMHGQFEIVLVKTGRMQMTIQGETLTAEEGEAVLIAPYTAHGFSDQISHTVCILEFPPEFTPPLFDYLKHHRSDHPIVHLPDALKAYLWFKLSDIPRSILPLVQAQAVLMPICDAFLSGCPFTETVERYGDSFLHAMRIVSWNINKPLSLESVAAEVGVRKETLIRQFRRQTGKTFWEIVLSLRTSYSISLLRNGSSVTEAAFDAGFGSVRSFNRVFKEKTGMTPREYLRQTPPEEQNLYYPEFSVIDPVVFRGQPITSVESE